MKEEQQKKGILIRSGLDCEFEVGLVWNDGYPAFPIGTKILMSKEDGVEQYLETADGLIRFTYTLPVSDEIHVLSTSRMDQGKSSSPLRWVPLDEAVELLEVSNSDDYSVITRHLSEILALSRLYEERVTDFLEILWELREEKTTNCA